MRRKVILGHPFGNANVRQALQALSEENSLEKFVTMLCAEHVPFSSCLPRAVRNELQRRSFKMLPSNQITSYPIQEITRLFLNRLSRRASFFRGFGPNVDEIWRSLDVHLLEEVHKSNKRVDVYAYEDGAFETFSATPDAWKIYELPIGHWRTWHSLLQEERELSPEWAPTLSGVSDSTEKLSRKDRELDLADQIIVPSDFVQSTLPEGWRSKSSIVRYGCPAVSGLPIPNTQNDGRIKVLFCGSLGQRKGIGYFFEAVKRMRKHIEVTVVGSVVAPCAALEEGLRDVKWYPSLPHSTLLELMRANDVFVFPTLFEGRALVVLEALSQGLPVITTTHSGASDVIENGRSGFLIPIRSPDAIVESLELLHNDRRLLQYMKEQAAVVASTTTWKSYRRELVAAIDRDRISR